MRIGIDFGTTHTTAAYYDGKQLHFIPLDEANKDPQLLRSMIYMTKDHEVILGIAAAQTYLQDNTGRLTRLVPKHVGTIENTVARLGRGPLEPDGPIVIVYDVHVEEDVGAPGRLIQSVKTGLRDPEYPGTSIYDRFFSLPELIAILLTHVKQQAEAHLGEPVTDVVIGRPVKFADTPANDAYAQDRLHAAAELAGFSAVSFVPEPVAAAYFYTLNIDEPKTLLVFDFGGGTLDLTIMQANGQQTTEILATQGVLVGGDNFDSAIMRGKVASYFGTESAINRLGRPFPAYLTEKLYQWQTIPELSKAEQLPIIRRAMLYGDNPEAFAALECLVLKNYGFALFEIIEQAKRALSMTLQTKLEMTAEAINLSLLLTRKEFQMFIVDEIAQVQQGIDKVLQKAAVTAADINVVVTTGGSALIPLFQNILRRRFSAAEIVHSDTFGSVAAGLAIQAHQESACGA